MPNNDPRTYSGYATQFAGLQDLIRYRAAKAQGASEEQALTVGDSGVGAPHLGGVSTTNSYGVAVPSHTLVSNLGTDPAAWRTARAQLTIGDQTVNVPIVDIGPGKKQQARGVVTDVTQPLSDGLGGVDLTKANIKIIPNAGPDYLTDRDAWDQEQADIGKQFPTGGTIGAEPAPTPSWGFLLADQDQDKKKQPANLAEALSSL